MKWSVQRSDGIRALAELIVEGFAGGVVVFRRKAAGSEPGHARVYLADLWPDWWHGERPRPPRRDAWHNDADGKDDRADAMPVGAPE